MSTGGLQDKVRIFCSYAHEDEALRAQLEKHLAALKRSGSIEFWYDGKIVPGTKWSSEIGARLAQADIILLLVSASFVGSDFCYGVELVHALRRYRARSALVIPIALKPVDWDGTPFERLQALPTNAKPVTTWSNRDSAFMDVSKGLRRAIDDLNVWRTKEAPSSAADVLSDRAALQRQGDLDLLKRVNIQINEAERQANRVFFDSILAESFAMRRASGEVLDRVEFLQAISLPPPPGMSRSTDVQSIRFLGQKRALVNCTVSIKVNEGMRKYLSDRLFVQGPEGVWKLLSWSNEPDD